MSCSWVVQNVNSDRRLAEAVVRLGHRLISYSGSALPSVSTAEQVVWRGSAAQLAEIEKVGWAPGAWHGPSFTTTAYANFYGEHYLNAGALVAHLSECLSLWETVPGAVNGHLFVRPDGDYKEFSGGRMSEAKLAKLLRGTGRGNGLSRDMLVLMAAPKEIAQEARFIVVNGVPVAGSLYRRNGRFTTGPAPESAWTFASVMASSWGPAAVYVLDVCVLSDGSMRVVECNCFNSSDLYACDAVAIVGAIASFLNS